MKSKTETGAKTEKNPIAQRLITAMEKPPHLTHEDVEALRQSIEEGKMPIMIRLLNLMNAKNSLIRFWRSRYANEVDLP